MVTRRARRGRLLDAIGAFDVDWDVLLPVVLIVVGAALVVAAWQGRGRGGLIALGVVITVVLSVATIVRVPLSGGIGDRVERPRLARRDGRPVELAIGKLTVDAGDARWSGTDVPGEVRVEAAVGMGQLVVLVGPDFPCVPFMPRPAWARWSSSASDGRRSAEYRTGPSAWRRRSSSWIRRWARTGGGAA